MGMDPWLDEIENWGRLNTIMHVSVHMKSAVNGSLFAY